MTRTEPSRDNRRVYDAGNESARRNADRMAATDAATRALGIAVDEVADGRATASMRISEYMINGHGMCHGGFVFLLADTAFAYACNTYGTPTVAAGADITFVAAVGVGELLTARADERVRYGRSGVYDVTVTRADGEVVAEFRGRSRRLPPARET